MRWSCYVTTVPERDVDAGMLARAGFVGHAEVVDEHKQLGPYGCFRRAVEMAMSDEWDALLVVQDDVRLACNLRRWLDRELWPCDASFVGVVSLWLPLLLSGKSETWWAPVNEVKYGSLAYVFTRRSAYSFSGARIGRGGRTKTETWVDKFCRHAGLRYILPPRSLCQHVGDNSAVNPDVDGRHLEYRTAGDDWVRDCEGLKTWRPLWYC